MITMKKIKINVVKPKCKEVCPIPLEIIPKFSKGIKNITYDKKSKMAEITYDERIVSKEGVIDKISKIGYEVRGES